jgi:hypothetical protein
MSNSWWDEAVQKDTERRRLDPYGLKKYNMTTEEENMWLYGFQRSSYYAILNNGLALIEKGYYRPDVSSTLDKLLKEYFSKGHINNIKM